MKYLQPDWPAPKQIKGTQRCLMLGTSESDPKMQNLHAH